MPDPVNLQELEARTRRLQAAGRHDEAIALYRDELRTRPRDATLKALFASALYAASSLQEAEAEFRAAIAIEPRLILAHGNYGNLLHDGGRFEEALACYRQALSLDPKNPAVLSSCGTVLSVIGRSEEAMAMLRQSLALRPGHALTICNVAFAQLRDGNFKAGWQNYEARLSISPRVIAPPPGARRWRGEEIAGQSILLMAEQGLGDTVQFVRYAPLLAARGATVRVEVQPPLGRLLRGVAGIAEIVTAGAPRPSVDWYCPLMSLPLAFGTSLDSIPGDGPYLVVDADLRAVWRGRLDELCGSGRMRVGLVWAGAPRPEIPSAHATDARRSMTLERLAPLAGIPGLTFVSLQKGPGATQAAHPPANLDFVDPMNEVDDFAGTAAIVSALDLVITVDTSMAHVAGALGKPVWVLSRYDSCWRWLRERTDTPWYPTMRLFRQRRPGGWDTVVAEVREALQALAVRERAT